MSGPGEEEHDVYVSQLREVFNSCDHTGDGFLERAQLEALCTKLQLQAHTPALLDQLLGHNGGPNAKVGFEEFKEGFVSVLSETVGESSEEEQEEEQESTTPPRHRSGEKRYGRTSRPEYDADGNEVTSPRQGQSAENSRIEVEEDEDNVEDERGQKAHTDVPPIHTGDGGVEQTDTFEAEGQLNHKLSDLEASPGGGGGGLDGLTEEEHLREIWRELGVGANGSLTVQELSTVCQHIGMAEMDDELIDLFDKLDTDCDGQVSFHEFLHGLFAHGSSTTVTPSTPVRPLSTPRASKLLLQHRLSVASGADGLDRQTPSSSTVLGMGAAGVFSSLDVDGTGYAPADSIIEYWENLGVPQGQDILEYLQFEIGSHKVNLADLSYSLEQEMRSVEEDNATYQAALSSVECELKQQRSVIDHLAAERDKLKSDLNEANSRISMLVKEGDERAAAIEKAHEKEALAVTKHYKDQLKAMQSELDAEREHSMTHSHHQTSKLENTIKDLKEEEGKLKDRLSEAQKEIERLEEEILDMVEKNTELERGLIRQQRELDVLPDLQKKLEEMEKSREESLDDYQKFSEQKIKQYVDDNKDLQDKYDELTMEVEDLRQQVSSQHRRRRGNRHHGNKDGATLLDEASLFDTTTAPELSDDDNQSQSSLTDSGRLRRRQLPTPPTDSSVPVASTPTVTESELQRCFSMERKDIEDMFKMEIAQLEDSHIRDKNNLLKGYKREKEQLAEEMKAAEDEAMEVERLRLREEFEEEKKDLAIRNESEKNLMEQKFAEEKAKIIARMNQEHEEEIELRLGEQRAKYTSELEKTVSRDNKDYDMLRQQIADLELDLQRQREETELAHEKEIQVLIDEFDAQKADLEAKHRIRMQEYERMFEQGPDHLTGRLKEDFQRLVERETAAGIDKEKEFLLEQFDAQRESMQRELAAERRAMEAGIQNELESSLADDQRKRDEMWQEQRDDLLREIQTERDALTLKFKNEKERKYKEKMKELEDSLQEERRQWETERDRLKAKMKREKERHDIELKDMRTKLSEEISLDMQGQLEDEFVSQLDRLRAAFDEERRDLQSRISRLEEELSEVNNTQTRDQARYIAQIQNMTADRKKTIADKMAEQQKKFAIEKRELEDRIRQLSVEKEEAVHAARVEKTLAATPQPRASMNNKAKLESLVEEKSSLQEELDITSQKLAEAETSLALLRSEQVRAEAERGELVDRAQHTALQHRLEEAERQASQLKAALQERSAQTAKLIHNSQDDQARVAQRLQAEKEAIQDRLDITKKLLQEQIGKLKNQLEKNAKTDFLVKDLYVENSHLIKCLQVTEKREKEAEKRVFKLEDKCKALTKVVHKMAPAALGY